MTGERDDKQINITISKLHRILEGDPYYGKFKIWRRSGLGVYPGQVTMLNSSGGGGGGEEVKVDLIKKMTSALAGVAQRIECQLGQIEGLGFDSRSRTCT